MLWLLALVAFAALLATYSTAVDSCFGAQARSNAAAVSGLLLLALGIVIGPLPTHWMRAAGYTGGTAGVLVGGAAAYLAGGVGYWMLHRRGVPDALGCRLFGGHDEGQGGDG